MLTKKTAFTGAQAAESRDAHMRRNFYCMSCDKEHFAPCRRAICIYAAFISSMLVDMTGADDIKQIEGRLNSAKANYAVLCRESCLDIKDDRVAIIVLLSPFLF